MKLPLPPIVEAWLARPTVAKMISFGVIGLGNTVLDFGVFTLGYTVLHLGLVPSNVLAWLVAVTCSYFLNTMITFRAESGRVLRRKDYFNFVASGILGVIATTATLVILSHVINVYAAKAASIFTGFVVNFTMSHFVVFRTKPAQPNEAPQ